jgi:hypothetical protein
MKVPRGKLSPGEMKFVKALCRDTINILFARKNPERRAIPDRITVRPNEARIIVRLNNFMANAINWMGKKVGPSTKERGLMYVRMLHLRDMNRHVRAILGKPGRTSPLYITGEEAKLYFHVLELVHGAFRLIKRNYAESAINMKAADAEADEAWWAIRSIINVGHLPVGKRPEFFGR